MKTNLTESFEIQNSIIRMQSQIINELIFILMQHEEIESVDEMPFVNKINEAAKLKESIHIKE